MSVAAPPTGSLFAEHRGEEADGRGVERHQEALEELKAKKLAAEQELTELQAQWDREKEIVSRMNELIDRTLAGEK